MQILIHPFDACFHNQSLHIFTHIICALHAETQSTLLDVTKTSQFITIPADTPEPGGARPSAGTMMIGRL